MTEIYRRYWKKLLAIAYNHIGDKKDAEEIVQDVFIKLWDKRGEVRIGSLPNYLAMAVKYSVFSAYQKRKRKEEVEERAAQTHSNQDFDEEGIYARFLQQYINGIVEKLPEKCKLVFKSSREEGKSTQQISKDLNIAEKTVEAHLTKAIKTIKYSLKRSDISTIITLLYILFK